MVKSIPFLSLPKTSYYDSKTNETITQRNYKDNRTNYYLSHYHRANRKMIGFPLLLSSNGLLAISVSVTTLTLLTLPLAKKRFIRGIRSGPSTTDNIRTALNKKSGPIYCRLCNGTGRRPCSICNETGLLTRGGFARRNTVRVASLVGTKWTSVSAIDGKWRHFLCVGKKGRNTKDGIAILSSTCGPVENRIRVEVPVSELKSRQIWEGGWTTLKDIRTGDNMPFTTCSACRGEKQIICPRCDGIGQVGL